MHFPLFDFVRSSISTRHAFPRLFRIPIPSLRLHLKQLEIFAGSEPSIECRVHRVNADTAVSEDVSCLRANAGGSFSVESHSCNINSGGPYIGRGNICDGEKIA
jgi:hypothetical protein